MRTQCKLYIGVVCLTFLDIVLTSKTYTIRTGFDENECQGPIKIYEELGCTPVYKKLELNCPSRYNCNHIKRRSPEKCYIDGKEYSDGDKLPDEYTDDPCTVCICTISKKTANFECLSNLCSGRFKEGCYLRRNATECCPGPLICPEKKQDIPTCQVDGVTYYDGDLFYPLGEPQKKCFCGPGYKGRNVKPFCLTRKQIDCNTEFYYGNEITKRCAPIYDIGKSPQVDCNSGYRCQNSKDVVVIPQKFISSFTNSKARCIFGNLKLRIGHRLDRSSYYRSTQNCMDCICQTPPFLTCKRQPVNLCDDNADIFEKKKQKIIP
ncbi:hypothetical protein HCN44_001927 [Aphidius gifuensis]|uniref:Uncharacterized protein n=1 Tax=Aphidius gifuensis TaxID=684658 RepID=A0A834Y1Q6_APHGI|nr:hypothetical protein HCN44_001927 [Aphidius gifuensis]